MNKEKLERLKFLESTQPKLVELIRKLKDENLQLKQQIKSKKSKKLKWFFKKKNCVVGDILEPF